MQALILAAGRGERMRPLTDERPKPLLEVAGKPLIEWHLEALQRAGFSDVVINHAWLGEQIPARLGSGERWNLRITYSAEGDALETLGGIRRVLHRLHGAFALISADIFTDFDYRRLASSIDLVNRSYPTIAAHFIMVNNPPFHEKGDFSLEAERIGLGADRLTYGNLAVFHASVFNDVAPDKKLKLFPWANGLIEAGRVRGELFDGRWENVGTVDQLRSLNEALAAGRERSR